jgi:periplasmic copper chaperone A
MARAMAVPSIFIAAIALAAPAARAHVTLEYQVAPAASSYKASFRVGHGCGSSPTRQLVVMIPAGVKTASPMPKPGWSIDIARDKDLVSRVSWTAKSSADALPPSHYDEFILVARLPDKPGALFWPVQQICEEGRHDWVEVPRAGQPRSELKSPAAYLEVMPGGGSAGHQH